MKAPYRTFLTAAFTPALLPFLGWMRRSTRASLTADLLAGLTGAVIVLPQGVAYAMIAGLPPQYGLYSAIIIPVVAGLFGSSLHLISGPAAALSIVVLSVTSAVAEPGSDLFIPTVLTLTLMTGLIQLGLGLARMGVLVNFISHTVVLGFTAGAAVLIATSQLKYVIGASVPAGSSFIDTWLSLAQQLGSSNLYAVAIALLTLLATLLIKRLNPRLPAMLLGTIAGGLGCWLLDGAANGIPLVGALPATLPGWSLPPLNPETLSVLLPGALAVAMLGLVEAVSIARAIAIRSGQHIDGNQEFIGQGLANLVGSCFSCYVGSGSFTRSGANYDAGARTPAAAIFAALILVLIVLLLPQATRYLPLPAMAGTILLIAWNLIDWHHIKEVLRSNRQEAAVFLVTFVATLVIALEFAIYVGVLLSLLLYLRRTSKPRVMRVAPQAFEAGTDFRSVARFKLAECPQLQVIRIDGSIFFGAIDHLQRELMPLTERRDGEVNLLLLCPGINFIDIAGAQLLIQLARRIEQSGGRLSFCALKNTVRDDLEAMGMLAKLGPGNFYPSADAALADLLPPWRASRCVGCRARVFRQCPPPGADAAPAGDPQRIAAVACDA